eukprot:CAMPEP_0170595904 /NCGR_PEP_ID=MMETSP0224-20130122/14816_1 /TAXON_ID=285029 /ORGANISM="Togula jolla, Strain CCCM 725" /LENGTH=158 /DNA_ID=CAMNT_0010920127 /DNA_START=84 /DNA_END=561 /DNA_ORIENTATION=+
MTASSLRVLPTNTDAPVVAETTVEPDALHALKVLAETLVQEVGILLARLPVLDVTLTIEHPRGNLELQRVADHGHHFIDLVRRELSCALVQIDVALLADNVRETATNTLDGGEGVHYLLAAVNVGVAHTQNVLEVLDWNWIDMSLGIRNADATQGLEA